MRFFFIFFLSLIAAAPLYSERDEATSSQFEPMIKVNLICPLIPIEEILDRKKLKHFSYEN